VSGVSMAAIFFSIKIFFLKALSLHSEELINDWIRDVYDFWGTWTFKSLK
jgi:hypothetical protein